MDKTKLMSNLLNGNSELIQNNKLNVYTEANKEADPILNDRHTLDKGANRKE